MKACKTCGVLKPSEDFNKSKTPKGLRASRGGDGRETSCAYCKAEKRSPGIHARREAAEKEAKELREEGFKRCSKCSAIKPVANFSKRAASPDGVCPKCKDCYKIYAAVWRAENPEAHKVYYVENKDRRSQDYKKWREENVGYRAAYMAKWAVDNKALVNEKIAYRNAIKRRATAAWADRAKIKEIYTECVRITEETGVPHEVDHIYPLQGKTVCGLHCQDNLNIITQFENIQKSNRMPTEEYLQRCKK